MKKYEKPIVEFLIMQREDIITSSPAETFLDSKDENEGGFLDVFG